MGFTVASTFLCGDDDDAIGTAGTVDGRCGTVFKHVERFDVVRIDIGQACSWDTVEHDQRAYVCFARRYAAYLQTCGRVRVGSGSIHYRKSRHLTLDKHGHIRSRDRLEIFGADMRYGRCQLFLVDSTVTDDNRFTQALAILLKYDFYVGTPFQGYILGLISDIRHSQCGIGVYVIQLKRTLFIGDRCRLGALYHN